MAGSLAERLRVARGKLFVGRETERALFCEAIESPQPPFCVLYIYGLGGVGKTTLLGNLNASCAEKKIPCVLLDARNFEPSSEAFHAALALSLQLDSPASLPSFLSDQTQRFILCIDTYELLAPLDNWLREEFLPGLSDSVLVVLAGRLPPAAGWRLDSGWQKLVCTLPLENLSSIESRAYLDKRKVPTLEHQAVWEFTHGHPMALSLVADLFEQPPKKALQNVSGNAPAGGRFRFEPQAAPDIMRVLLEHLVQGAPTSTHRAALEACALVRQLTEDLLAAMLEIPDAHEIFEWLRGLSFIQSDGVGLIPHDLTREVLISDVRWRNPEQHAQLQHRARQYYLARLRQTTGQAQQRVLSNYIFLHRTNPVIRPFFEWQESGTLMPALAREDELPALVKMVAKHKGAAAARLAESWFKNQPQGVLVLRDGDGAAAGFLFTLNLNGAAPEELQADAGTRAAWSYLQREAPLRPGENASLVRFWMASDTPQAVSAAQSLVFVNIVRHYLTAPKLAFSFFCCADPDFWTPAFEYADSPRLHDADFEVGKKSYGMFGHDWRVTPPMVWLELLAEREIATSAIFPTAPPPAFRVLGEREFPLAVRAALHDFSRPPALSENALLHSRLVNEIAGIENSRRIAVLQNLLKEACETLQAAPQTEKYYQALFRTYFQPAASQEQTAELLDISFSTFRRHLKEGMQRLTEILWQRELGALGTDERL